MTSSRLAFWGDQYVAIYPQNNEGGFLGPNDLVAAEEPFNLQEVARSAAGFIKHVDDTVAKLNAAINDVRRLVLNEQTLTNLAFTIGTLRQVSEDAAATVNNVNQLVVSNQVSVTATISNLVTFSAHLNVVAQSLQSIVDTNGQAIATAINNVQAATASVTNLLSDVQAGHGLAGSLLKNEALAANFSLLTSNLTVTSSNLNRLGLWRVIWGPQASPGRITHYHRARRSRAKAVIIMSLWYIRILFLAMCMMGGYAISQVRPEFVGGGAWGLMLGFGFGGLLIAVDEMLKGFSLRAFSATSFGLLLGSAVGALIDHSGTF